MPEPTNTELADALMAVTKPNFVLGVGDVYRIHAAVDLIRGMPDGERIEGWVGDDYRGLLEFAAESELYPFAPGLTSRRATLILHPQEPTAQEKNDPYPNEPCGRSLENCPHDKRIHLAYFHSQDPSDD